MLSLGWPLTIESEWGGTPLHWAAWNGRTSLVLDLLARGAPLNQRDSRYGSSPIAWAAHGSRFSLRGDQTAYPAIVTALIAAGASHAAAINRWGEPPERLATDSVRTVLMSSGFVTAVP
jgi:ankyrin repeat protein